MLLKFFDVLLIIRCSDTEMIPLHQLSNKTNCSTTIELYKHPKTLVDKPLYAVLHYCNDKEVPHVFVKFYRHAILFSIAVTILSLGE